jgi:hypothetical protein
MFLTWEDVLHAGSDEVGTPQTEQRKHGWRAPRFLPPEAFGLK